MSREELLFRMEAARDAVCIRAYPDGYRLYDGDTRLEGPWSETDLGLAREARDRAQLEAMLAAVLNPLLERVAGTVGPWAALGRSFNDQPGTHVSMDAYLPYLRQAASLHTELKGLLDG